jgi:uncharacterized cupredoxin-like copper-binding protein
MSIMARMSSVISGLALAACLAGGATAAETVVNVQLLDSTSKPAVAGMAMRLDVDKVPSGHVSFHVKNLSKSFVHEMVLVPVADASASLPYDDKSKRVKEEGLKSKGEVSDLGPGKSGKLTVELAPGAYKLICNVAGHYKQGMWADLTVTQGSGT